MGEAHFMFSNNSWQYDLLLCFHPGLGTKGLSLDFPFHIWAQGCISVRIESCKLWVSSTWGYIELFPL